MYAKVLIQYKVKSLDRMFTYKIPSTLNLVVGSKVKVPFGNVCVNISKRLLSVVIRDGY